MTLNSFRWSLLWGCFKWFTCFVCLQVRRDSAVDVVCLQSENRSVHLNINKCSFIEPEKLHLDWKWFEWVSRVRRAATTQNRKYVNKQSHLRVHSVAARELFFTRSSSADAGMQSSMEAEEVLNPLKSSQSRLIYVPANSSWCLVSARLFPSHLPDM